MSYLRVLQQNRAALIGQGTAVLDAAKAENRPLSATERESIDALDKQIEAVQKGLDFDEFVQFGYFNDNHSQATSAVVGVPDMAEYRDGKGWYTEGKLLKGFPRADEIWEAAKKAAAALGVLPWLLDDCARRGLLVGPLAEHAADGAGPG